MANNLNLNKLAIKLAPRNVKHSGIGYGNDQLGREWGQADGQAKLEASILAKLEAMPSLQQRYLSVADYWATKAPQSEIEDWRSEIYLQLAEAQPEQINLIWAIAHNSYVDLLRAWIKHRGFCDTFSTNGGFDSSDPYASRTIEDIASEVPYLDNEFDYIVQKLDAKALWKSLNVGKHIKGILSKRLRSQALSNTDRSYLHRWLKAHKSELEAQAKV